MKRLSVLLLAFVVVACAGDPATRATTSLALACGSIGKINLQLAPMITNRTLSDSQVKVVVGIRDATAPFCDPKSSVDPVKVIGFVEASLGQLQAILGSK